MYKLYSMSFIRKIKKGKKVYLAEVESKWINGKSVQRHIKYIGKEADGKTILSSSISNIEVEQVKLYGPLLVLNYLASEINLSEQLGKYGKEILSMVYAHCLDYKSINAMRDWFEKTDLNMLLKLEDLTEKRLLNALDFIEKNDLEVMQEKIFSSVKKRYNIKGSGIIYDVTNTYLYGKQCPFGKLGHDKEGVKGRPLIQIGLGITQEEGFPVFHKVFDGNIHDARTLQDLISSFHHYHIKQGMIVYDRGISSADNLKDIAKLKWDTLSGLPIKQNLKKIIRSLISQNSLIHLKNRVRLNKTIFYVVSLSYEIKGIKGVLVLCFNEYQKRELRESRYDEVVHAQMLLQKNKKIKSGLEKYFDKQGDIIYKRLEEAEEFDGYSCIFSTRQLPKEEIVRIYFDKDIIERAFKSLKGIVRLQPIRHWLYNRVISHVFICYISYLLLSLLKYRLKKIKLSPIEALKELDTMYKVYMRDAKKGFKISRVVTLTKNQKTILNTISRKLLKT